jgi:hypothetical protein
MTTVSSRTAVPRTPARRSPPGWPLLLLGLALLLAVRRPCPAQDESSTAPVEVGEAPIFSAGPFEYRPGRGLRLDSIGVIGGFTNVKLESTDDGDEFSLDTLNVFLIFDHFTRFRAVAELEFKDIFVANSETVGGRDFAFDVRRLFGDFTIADELRLRVGTFITPVGYWNLILAPPLTWTTEAPVIVEKNFFQPTTTGVMLYGSTGAGVGQLGYSVFSQLIQPLQNDPDLTPPDYTASARLTYDIAPVWSAGATFQAAERDAQWSYLGALDLLWEHRRGQILTECYAQGGDALTSTQWGAYVQGVYNVWGPFYLVGRYEHYDQPSPNPTLNILTGGAVWKPFPFMAVKTDYRYVDRTSEDPSGFFLSFTSFF